MSNAATKIRSDLKAAGYASRAISVRTSSSGSVTVEIKDASIQSGPIKEIAFRQQVINRCETSGEILCGGNTLVFVGYAREALAVAGARITEMMKAGRRDFGGLEIESKGAHALHTWKIWSDSGRFIQQISPNDGESVARVLAERGELTSI